MARFLICSAVLTLLIVVPGHPLPDAAPAAAATPAADADQPSSEVPAFMRGKLKMVGAIVEGMATEDFEMVSDGARELAELAESAAWAADRDPFYRHYSSSFEQAVGGLLSAAESESVEKVTFAYVHVTFSCTACHQHVRNVNRVAF